MDMESLAFSFTALSLLQGNGRKLIGYKDAMSINYNGVQGAQGSGNDRELSKLVTEEQGVVNS